MKLTEIEKQFGVTFPKGFHRIYDTGAMEFLELPLAEFQKVRKKYDNDPKAFMMMIKGDVEPLFFEEIPERAKELEELLSYRAKDSGEALKSGIKLVPFAQTNAGDMYLFVYEGTAEPRVILYYNDCLDDPLFCGRDYDEFLFYALLNALQWGGDMQGEAWQHHMKNYLSEQYRARIRGLKKEALITLFEDLGVELDRNAATIFEVK